MTDVVFHMLSFVNVSAIAFGSPACYLSFDYYDRLRISTIVPLVVFGVIIFVFFPVHYLYYRWYGKDIADLIRRYFFCILFLAYLFLPSVTVTIFGAFTCTNIDPQGLVPGTPTYLRNDYSISCNSKRYKQMVAWAITMVRYECIRDALSLTFNTLILILTPVNSPPLSPLLTLIPSPSLAFRYLFIPSASPPSSSSCSFVLDTKSRKTKAFVLVARIVLVLVVVHQAPYDRLEVTTIWRRCCKPKSLNPHLPIRIFLQKRLVSCTKHTSQSIGIGRYVMTSHSLVFSFCPYPLLLSFPFVNACPFLFLTLVFVPLLVYPMSPSQGGGDHSSHLDDRRNVHCCYR